MTFKSALPRIARLTMIFILMVGLGSSFTSAMAQPPSPSRQAVLPPSDEPVQPATVDPMLLGKTGRIAVVIELVDQPTSLTYANSLQQGTALNDATQAAVQQLATIKAKQQTLTASLSSAAINAQVIYSVQRVYNGIGAYVDASKLKEIARLSGVKAIHPLVSKTIENAYSVPLIGAPQTWGIGLGTKGENIKVGIIDTGIDYLHTDFGGPGTPASYTANNPTIVGDAPNYPGVKVAGGYDFVGNAYDANNTTDPNIYTPMPDPDPMDCNGHGSHVAGTTAGYGVNADGTTFTGSYGPGMDFAHMTIGPGVAPKAIIYALKVFGCSGSTNVTDAAIDWAADPNGDGNFADHLDVINMSLGSDYAGFYDSSAVASENAVKVGVIVVAAAGNAGDAHYIAGSPANATGVISVAASTSANTSILSVVKVNSPANIAGLYSATQAAFGAQTTAPITADLAYDAANPIGCTPWTGTPFTGKIALIYRGTCGFVVKVKNAQDAGALAVIISNNQPGTISMGGADPTITIPSVSITKADGDKLKAELIIPHVVNVTLDPALSSNAADMLAGFSSRGPRRIDSLLKPDITAPGVNIFSVANGTGTQGESLSGTSMATPHVTGVMALLRQLHPTWTVEELKALAMNTATHDLYNGLARTGEKYSPSYVGAGRVDVYQAAQNQVILYNADVPNAVSVSFGNVDVADMPVSISHKVGVVNKGKMDASYKVSFEDRSAVAGVTFSLTDNKRNALTSLDLKAGASTVITITMMADPSKMTHPINATEASTLTINRFWLSEASGLIRLDATAPAQSLRLPVLAVPQPVSQMHADKTTFKPATQTGTFDITLQGKGVNTTSTTVPAPVGEQSLVAAMQLAYTSPDDQMTAIGDPAIEKAANAGDLKYVGVLTDRPAVKDMASATIYFGIAMQGPWSTPNAMNAEVDIDTNNDGSPDYALYTTNLAITRSTSNSDEFVAALYNVATGQITSFNYLNVLDPATNDTRAFNNSVLVMNVAAADLGLTDANSKFSYVVYSSAAETNFSDVSPVLSYDVMKPAITIDMTNSIDAAAPSPFFADMPGQVIHVGYDVPAGQHANGVLLLHFFNPANSAAQGIHSAEVVGFVDHFMILPVIFR